MIRRPRRAVPPALEAASEWMWRLLVIAAAVWVVFRVVRMLWAVALTVAVALLFTALLKAPADRLRRHGVPGGAATAAVLGGAVVAFAAVMAFIVPRFLEELDELQRTLVDALASVRQWLVHGPLSLPPGNVDRLRGELIDVLRETLGVGSGSGIAAALSGAMLVLELVAAALLGFVLVFFFVKDGDAMARWSLRHLAADQREPARRMATAAWSALTRYLRGVALIAAFNAVLTAAGLTVIGVPLVLSLTVIEFVLSWIPIVGALVAGALAVLVALVSGGVTDALLVLALAILIDQMEGHFLQPVVIGHAVHLHPVVVLVVLSVGGILAGIGGALLAVPLTAAVVAAVSALRDWRGQGAGSGPGEGSGRAADAATA